SRADSARRGALDRATNRRGARGGAREGDYSSRLETGKYQSAARRHREGARLRTRKIRRGIRFGRATPTRHAVADDYLAGDDDERGHDPRYGRVHGAGTGAGRVVDKRADVWAFGCIL